MISWKTAESNLPKQFCMVGTRHFRPRQMTDIQYGIKIMDGREVSKALKKSKRGILEPLETAYCG